MCSYFQDKENALGSYTKQHKSRWDRIICMVVKEKMQATIIQA